MPPHTLARIISCLAAAHSLAFAGVPSAPTATDAPPSPGAFEVSDFAEQFENFNRWDIGEVLFPNVHIHGIGGFSTANPDDLHTGGHDPVRESPSAQAIEPALSLRTAYIEGFTNYTFFQDARGDWDGELEEAFGKVINLPGGFELKGGQFLSRFGATNTRHGHAAEFVDSELVNARFLGEHGLLLRGAEASWTLPLGMEPTYVSILSLGFGEMRPSSHDDEHPSGGEETEPAYDGEEGTLEKNIWTARLLERYRFSDFHSLTGGVSWATGDNRFGRSTNIGGIDIEYLWRENGLAPAGRALRWRNEFLRRWVEANSDPHHTAEASHDEHDGEEELDAEAPDATFDESGIYSSLIYTWNEHVDTGLRVGWIEGIPGFGQAERFQISPNVSCWLDKGRRIGARIQYNYDQLDGSADEHGVWFQVNIALGSTSEVR